MEKREGFMTALVGQVTPGSLLGGLQGELAQSPPWAPTFPVAKASEDESWHTAGRFVGSTRFLELLLTSLRWSKQRRSPGAVCSPPKPGVWLCCL